MPNHDLMGHTFKVPERYRKNVNGNDSISYSHMKKIKSELTNKETQTASDQDFLRWIDGELKKAANVTDAPKRIKMETGAAGKKGGGNNYKDTHYKDRKNKNPTAIGGLPDVTTMSLPRNIMNNKVDYVKESLNGEMNKIMYLIEYMNNNKLKLN
jgi:hypothetical protein